MKHFGETLIKRKYSFELCKEEFALMNTRPSLMRFEHLIKENAYTDDTYSQYDMDWCLKYREICLKNYDNNMLYFQSLSADDFNAELSAFLKRNSGFQEIKELRECDGMAGYYIMVLDKYRQVYIGKSNDIRKRIRQHWSDVKSFDRTLFPMYNEYSVFSVDFFRALDTNRIFVREGIEELEESLLVADFPQKYITNRIGGDVKTGMMAFLTKIKH